MVTECYGLHSLLFLVLNCAYSLLVEMLSVFFWYWNSCWNFYHLNTFYAKMFSLELYSKLIVVLLSIILFVVIEMIKMFITFFSLHPHKWVKCKKLASVHCDCESYQSLMRWDLMNYIDHSIALHRYLLPR